MKNINDYLEELLLWIFSEQGELFFGVMTYVFAIAFGVMYTGLILFADWWNVNIHIAWSIPTSILTIIGVVGLYNLIKNK